MDVMVVKNSIITETELPDTVQVSLQPGITVPPTETWEIYSENAGLISLSSPFPVTFRVICEVEVPWIK